MLKKILIANRGAIAVRILRTLNQLGVKSVAVYAEADADSPHVMLADEAYSLGDGPVSSTYLNVEKILEIAAQSGVDGVHPGYGFLSENSAFCEKLKAIGVAFIGPTSEQINLFGLKHEARRLANESGVPLAPGSDLLASIDEAIQTAESIGFPLMLKSTAGGGGIGMQIVRDSAELESCWDGIIRLSESNFSNGGVFLEKYVEFARHIEVQVFGDGCGKALILGDRDCSAQRRHQKVIEEAPAPNLPQIVREQMHTYSKNLVEKVNYRNAGTVEFIYDQTTQEFYFLEMNTRLQVEHGVSECVFGVDIVEWMVKLASGDLPPIDELKKTLDAKGHSVQARIYAENPLKNFQPSAGEIRYVEWPQDVDYKLRVDTWVESGTEVSSFFDPMLAKVIVYADTREQAISALVHALSETKIEGLETNIDYVSKVLQQPSFLSASMYTRYLSDFKYSAPSCEVLQAGTQTTVQDFPGRVGYWDIGVPPSGPFDDLSFRIGNQLLGNPKDAAGLEMTISGPSLKFYQPTNIVLCGAQMEAEIDGVAIKQYEVFNIKTGQVLRLGKCKSAGARSYLLISGGFQCEPYLGSKSTFTLGQFGGQHGRALRVGDFLHYPTCEEQDLVQFKCLPKVHRPEITGEWELRVIYGPHGAPDFFTAEDIETFFSAKWKVHYNSSRTGVRLIGPKPNWARSDGGEAGMHPSNIHDNAYAVGSIDFTGDMPVILGPDGPSLGGFVCPATVIKADMWKLGQLHAGDTVTFKPVSYDSAITATHDQRRYVNELTVISTAESKRFLGSPIIDQLDEKHFGEQVVYRAAGEDNVLVEYGPLKLDIQLRFRVHALMQELQSRISKDTRLASSILDLTPGIRSLQIHFDPLNLARVELIELLKDVESEFSNLESVQVSSRTVYLPLSWNDQACQLAVDKYMQSVRKDAPWCPDNIEFIRRINGLNSVDEVKKIVFDAAYVVMGLGDVYLGAPVATPLDPRHRLVTTKYNPARTWTAENSVGIGGSYLCVYGMEGPGGYQFIGRTLQMWNRYKQTQEFSKPWLLRFFDQIRFYEVTESELTEIRKKFPHGRYPLRVEEGTFSMAEYTKFLDQNESSISEFLCKRDEAFGEELDRWVESGQLKFEPELAEAQQEGIASEIPNDCLAIESPVSGSVWKLLVEEGETVEEGQCVLVLESMKMEIEVPSLQGGVIKKIFVNQGQSIQAGQLLAAIEPNKKEEAV